MRRILTWLLWVFLFIVLAVVIYWVWTQFFAGDEEDVVGSVVKLECTSECAARGQCGTTVESPKVDVVLGGLDAPIVEPKQHDRYIPAGVTVEIKDTRSERLEQVNGRQFDQTFSRVEWRNTMGDVQKTGWFADWCVQTQ